MSDFNVEDPVITEEWERLKREVPYCVEDGCYQPATTERPSGMVGDTPIVELVCADHTETSD